MGARKLRRGGDRRETGVEKEDRIEEITQNIIE